MDRLDDGASYVHHRFEEPTVHSDQLGMAICYIRPIIEADHPSLRKEIKDDRISFITGCCLISLCEPIYSFQHFEYENQRKY